MPRLIFVFALAISAAFALTTTGHAQEDAADAAATIQADSADTAVSPSDVVPPEPVVEANSPAIASEPDSSQPGSQSVVPAPMPINGDSLGGDSFTGGVVDGGAIMDESFAAPMMGDSIFYDESPTMLNGAACCQAEPVCCQPEPCCTPQRRGFFRRLFHR